MPKGGGKIAVALIPTFLEEGKKVLSHLTRSPSLSLLLITFSLSNSLSLG